MSEIALKIIGTPQHRVWSLDGKTRLQRTFARVAKLDDVAANRLLIQGDWVLDGRLAKVLVESGDVVLVGQGEVAAIRLTDKEQEAAAEGLVGGAGDAAKMLGLPIKNVDELAGTYNDELRKHEPATLIKLDGSNRDQAERATFQGSYKGVTDFVTKYVWPWPARHATRLCAALRISPNMVTTLSLVMTVLAFYLFWIGEFGWGIAAAWFMTFLDTVDGKLARVTMTYSAWGNVYDHGIDLIHPPFWYWAWAVGLVATGQGGDTELLNFSLWIINGGYVFGRLIEGWFIRISGMHIHVWRPMDSFMREITARRNPNLAILMVLTLFSAPLIGFHLVALWTVLCTVFHVVRLAQAMAAKSAGRHLTSWLDAN